MCALYGYVTNSLVCETKSTCTLPSSIISIYILNLNAVNLRTWLMICWRNTREKRKETIHWRCSLRNNQTGDMLHVFRLLNQLRIGDLFHTVLFRVSLILFGGMDCRLLMVFREMTRSELKTNAVVNLLFRSIITLHEIRKWFWPSITAPFWPYYVVVFLGWFDIHPK